MLAKLFAPTADILDLHNGTGIFCRALDKREYLVTMRNNFCYFCIKTYVVAPYLNRLNEMVQMRLTTYGFDEK